MLDPAILCCPTCKASCPADYRPGEGQWKCACGACFRTVEGILDLMPSEIAAEPNWSQWERHLEAFAARRRNREENPEEIVSRLTISGGGQQGAFARFTGIESGIVLDIGCGPGKFRGFLPDAVAYIGLDPLPLPDVSNIDFIRGVGEYLPFAAHSIAHITVLSALDHFNDCDQFLREATRVLRPGGKLHIIQQVHEPIWSIRGIAHEIKDALEDRKTRHDTEVPHHMTEFDEASLRNCLNNHFKIDNEQLYSVKWYAPRRLFLTLSPRRAVG